MSSLKKMKLVPIENNSIKFNEPVISDPKVDNLTKEDEVMNVAKSNLDDTVKKNIIKTLYVDEMNKNSKSVNREPRTISRKLLTPPSKKKPRISKKSSEKKDLFEKIKWNPY